MRLVLYEIMVSDNFSRHLEGEEGRGSHSIYDWLMSKESRSKWLQSKLAIWNLRTASDYTIISKHRFKKHHKPDFSVVLLGGSS